MEGEEGVWIEMEDEASEETCRGTVGVCMKTSVCVCEAVISDPGLLMASRSRAVTNTREIKQQKLQLALNIASRVCQQVCCLSSIQLHS